MADGIDRSKYRNPDMPVGYVKQDPELQYLEGIEYEGVHYVWAPYIYEAHLEERSDQDELSDLGFMSPSSEEEVLEEEEGEVEDEENVAKDTGTKEPSLPCNIKKEKEAINIKKEPIEKDDSEKKVRKHKKKSHDNSDASALSASLSAMDIDNIKWEKKKKHKKTKKESRTDYRSEDSSPSSVHRHNSPQSKNTRHSPPSKNKHHSPSSRNKHHSPSSLHRYSPMSDRYENIKSYSPSPRSSPEPYQDVKIKQEPTEPPEHLFGHYHCDTCNITMNSLLTYNTHINGKRHLKNLKLKNTTEVVARSIPATAVSEDQSRYPKPPSGVIRKKVQTTAAVQQVLERGITQPCPGLNFVTEIQGLGGVQYYCSLCDSVCSSSSISSHLTGFKHQLKSVKQFKPGAYEYMQYEQKYKIEKDIQNILYAVEKKQGKGRMMVEVEELAETPDDWSKSTSEPSTSRDYPSLPSTSSRGQKSRSSRDLPSTSRGTGGAHSESFHEKYDRATIPDTSASDFYCRICQSHMNSLQMWDAHVRGKRHLTNLKKMPGDMPSKTKTILVANRRAILLDRIKFEAPGEPFVGLSEVRETEIHETKSQTYQCFLCGSCHTTLDIIEHLISLKHRTKYLEHIEFSGREVIAGMSDSAAYTLVRDMCIQVEEREGPGRPEVHVNKSSLFK